MAAYKPCQLLQKAQKAREREAILRVQSRQRSAKGKSIRVAPANNLLKMYSAKLNDIETNSCRWAKSLLLQNCYECPHHKLVSRHQNY